MNFLEKIKQNEDQQYDNRTFVKFSVILIFILIALFSRSHADEIQCPCCEYVFEIRHKVAPYEGRECPGAGWYCDSCGQFASQGSKCVYCGAKRK